MATAKVAIHIHLVDTNDVRSVMVVHPNPLEDFVFTIRIYSLLHVPAPQFDETMLVCYACSFVREKFLLSNSKDGSGTLSYYLEHSFNLFAIVNHCILTCTQYSDRSQLYNASSCGLQRRTATIAANENVTLGAYSCSIRIKTRFCQWIQHERRYFGGGGGEGGFRAFLMYRMSAKQPYTV